MTIFALLPSPLVGPLTWSLVAEELPHRGHAAVIAELSDDGAPGEPYWQRHSRSAAQTLNTAAAQPAVLVAHSGAGPLIAAIADQLAVPPAACLFVDAGIPAGGLSRLDLLASEDAEFANQFRQTLEAGGRFPEWSEDDLREVLPDLQLRRRMVAELRPRGLDFWSEPVPAFPGWPPAPCAYLQFSASYDAYARQAQAAGWPYRRIDAGHFHMLVEPVAVAAAMLELVARSG